ncbi:MAG: DUF4160 domain-containing protein [Candidatus Cryptobacteroides sp.]
MKILHISVLIISSDIPTIFILSGFRLLFYANDHEPIHVVKGNINAKFTLFPEVELIDNNGLKPDEQTNLLSIKNPVAGAIGFFIGNSQSIFTVSARCVCGRCRRL